jgi:hypothetical protein
VVPRKGLSGTARKTSRINDLVPPPLARLYQGNVLLSTTPTADVQTTHYNGPSETDQLCAKAALD